MLAQTLPPDLLGAISINNLNRILAKKKTQPQQKMYGYSLLEYKCYEQERLMQVHHPRGKAHSLATRPVTNTIEYGAKHFINRIAVLEVGQSHADGIQ
jgi:hypothetical protein